MSEDRVIFSSSMYPPAGQPLQRVEVVGRPALHAPCRVYWGTHGCDLPRGHDGPHTCDCCECPDHAANPIGEDGALCVGKPPYYGPLTAFYGEDVS